MLKVLQQAGSRSGHWVSRPLALEPLPATAAGGELQCPTHLCTSLPPSSLSAPRLLYCPQGSLFQALFWLRPPFCCLPAQDLMTANPAQRVGSSSWCLAAISLALKPTCILSLSLFSIIGRWETGLASSLLNNQCHHPNKWNGSKAFNSCLPLSLSLSLSVSSPGLLTREDPGLKVL